MHELDAGDVGDATIVVAFDLALPIRTSFCTPLVSTMSRLFRRVSPALGWMVFSLARGAGWLVLVAVYVSGWAGGVVGVSLDSSGWY